MKSLKDFFSDRLDSNYSVSMKSITGGSTYDSTRTECHEDTFSNNSCDEYIQVTDDEGKMVSSNTIKVACEPT